MTDGVPVNISDEQDCEQYTNGRENEIQVNMEAVDQTLGQEQLDEVNQVFDNHGGKPGSETDQCAEDEDELAVTNMLEPPQEKPP